MTTKARIENNVVRELLTADPFPPFHPDLVWVECGSEVKEGWTYDGTTFAAPVPPAPTQADFVNAVQGHIDSVAASRGYDNGVSCASYATDPHQPFAADATAFIPWRSSVWLYCYTEWAKYEAGQRTMTTPSDFVAELPAIVW